MQFVNQALDAWACVNLAAGIIEMYFLTFQILCHFKLAPMDEKKKGLVVCLFKNPFFLAESIQLALNHGKNFASFNRVKDWPCKTG